MDFPVSVGLMTEGCKVSGDLSALRMGLGVTSGPFEWIISRGGMLGRELLETELTVEPDISLGKEGQV